MLAGHEWEALVIDSVHPALTREIVRARASAITASRAAPRVSEVARGEQFSGEASVAVPQFLSWVV
ncbi:hypothetical protein [Amycolatopsis sp. lyj-90]|uniref:hypothetical protein n=1 Tax=Amycolatopsis sp. lyj-90 TaxID=2789285 RepID=UPI00397CEB8F